MQYLNDNIIPLDKYKSVIKEEAQRLKTAHHFAQQVMESLQGIRSLTGLTLPWHKTHQDVRFRTHELSVWSGKSYHGKSLLLGQIALSLIAQNSIACVLSLEMPPANTVARLIRQTSTGNNPPVEFVQQFNQWTDGSLWIYDRMGELHWQTIVAMARYTWHELGVTDFIVDSLLKCGIPKDDFATQARFVNALADHCHHTGQRVHLVVHPRKTNNRQDFFNVMTADDIAGSGDLKNVTDNLFIFHRNILKEKEAEKPEPKEKIMNMADAYLVVDKQRNGEWSGSVKLWYHQQSMQYVEYETARPIPYYNMLERHAS